MAAIKDKLKKCYEQRFSSAGLLYVYINGYKKNEMVYSEQTNSYQCIGNEFCNRIREYLAKKELKLIPISWTIQEIYFIDVFRKFIVKE